jgi:hypothetical protein
MAKKCSEELPRGDIPELDRSIFAGTDQDFAIPAHTHIPDPICMACESMKQREL